MFAVTSSPVQTRKRARETTTESSSEAATLQQILAEMRLMREEQARREEECAEQLRQRDEELRNLRLQTQLSHSDNRESGDAGMGRADSGRVFASDCGERAELGYKLKPDTYDGTASLREFLLQFDLVARANRWGDSFKAIAFASSLRGSAHSVLETVQDLDSLGFAELKSRLELRLGETHSLRVVICNSRIVGRVPGKISPLLERN